MCCITIVATCQLLSWEATRAVGNNISRRIKGNIDLGELSKSFWNLILGSKVPDMPLIK